LLELLECLHLGLLKGVAVGIVEFLEFSLQIEDLGLEFFHCLFVFDLLLLYDLLPFLQLLIFLL
jgi:hypothetical protein